ncbi:DUF5413 family protein [Bradyrhizobium sp.]|uniref:DUF5413 family protein n=1 Tax=Bradyrhizobium sp. TaxID=376 RepID=UPI001DAB1454|nr:DUF5413 family protein [Bradyrhizobium sp.]MBI5321131.1 DUF5413 family protein [Bradyrhizobium sp.]
MKRYLIFAAIGPFVGGLLLLFVTTWQSGYWDQTSIAEVQKFFIGFIKTLQYNYLFGIVPALMVGSIDDILYHVRRIGPSVRIVLVGLVGFTAAVIYSARGPGSGILPYLLYGMVGLVPAMLSSWLAHKYADEQKAAVKV